ncbi:MAG: type IV secretion system DNA-binding domain-containing protein [Candidatus Campbellbacteria bacterium]|nr:type IV secretion system DNA-binding domain-containing protein [Candidatus Campbellbacteria bacterium]
MLNLLSNPILILIIAGASAIILGLIILFLFFIRKINKKKMIAQSLQMTLLSVSIYRDEKQKETKNPIEEVARSEQLFNALAAVNSVFAFEMALPYGKPSLQFFIRVARDKEDVTEEQIKGIFPEAKVVKTNDYTIFSEKSHAVGGYVETKKHFSIPIRTYKLTEKDTFLPILNTFTGASQKNIGLMMQVIVRQSSKSNSSTVHRILGRLTKGSSLKKAIKAENAFHSLVSSFSGAKDKKKGEVPQQPEVNQDEVEILKAKVEKPILDVVVRVCASATTEDAAESLFDVLSSGFGQFLGTNYNEFVVKKAKDISKFASDLSFSLFDESKRMRLNLAELVSIFHLPTFTDRHRLVEWEENKTVAPPHDLPTEGLLLGEYVGKDGTKEIRLSHEDRRRHIYSIGQTGTGKTSLIKSMVVQDIYEGRGVCVLDPAGDMIDDLSSLIPEHRSEDTILFNPDNLERPFALNMLEYDHSRPEEKTFIVNEILNIFKSLFSEETMGPMFEQYMRNALLLLMESEEGRPSTLIELPRIFVDEEFRRRKISLAKTGIVIDFWEKEASVVTGEASLSNITPYITSKFNVFIANDYIRPIMGQPYSSIDFRKIIDEGNVLLVKLSKGRIGEINQHLLGMMITNKLTLAAFAREDIPEESRKDFYLYIDEFQNFTTDTISTILSEARKYRLNLMIAHQYVQQLSDKIKGAVFGNVGTIVSFRIGNEDAEILEKQLEPSFSAYDLISMKNLNAAVRILSGGHPKKPFSMNVKFVDRGDREIADFIVMKSLERYGSPSEEVEDNIRKITQM